MKLYTGYSVELDAGEQEQKPVRICALVVSHNRAELLRRCLEALERSKGRESMEILVVENGSTDSSPDLETEFPHARFIRLPRNFGLTKALNIGVRSANGEFLLLLHDDTEVSPEAAGELASALESNSQAGAAIPLLVDAAGNPAPQVRNLLGPRSVNQPWRPATSDEPFWYASGAAIMFRSFFLRAMRQIDERYGWYGSDAELSAQVGRSGKKIVLVQSARVIHHGGGKDASRSERALRDADLRLGTAAYLGKHFGLFAGIKARLGAILGALGATLTLRDFGYNFSRLRFLISGQKIDGSQR